MGIPNSEILATAPQTRASTCADCEHVNATPYTSFAISSAPAGHTNGMAHRPSTARARSLSSRGFVPARLPHRAPSSRLVRRRSLSLTRGHAHAHARARRLLARPGEIKPGRARPGARSPRPLPRRQWHASGENPIMSPSSAARKILYASKCRADAAAQHATRGRRPRPRLHTGRPLRRPLKWSRGGGVLAEYKGCTRRRSKTRAGRGLGREER